MSARDFISLLAIRFACDTSHRTVTLPGHFVRRFLSIATSARSHSQATAVLLSSRGVAKSDEVFAEIGQSMERVGHWWL